MLEVMDIGYPKRGLVVRTIKNMTKSQPSGVKDRILKAAKELFISKGFAGTSMRYRVGLRFKRGAREVLLPVESKPFRDYFRRGI